MDFVIDNVGSTSISENQNTVIYDVENNAIEDTSNAAEPISSKKPKQIDFAKMRKILDQLIPLESIKEPDKHETFEFWKKPPKNKYEKAMFSVLKAIDSLESPRKSKIKVMIDDSVDEKKKRIEEIMKKSVITPEFESLHQVPPITKSDKVLKKERRAEREKTKGDKWFGMKAPELTEEVKRDLEVIQMRSALDPKRFYKKNDLKVLPKHFQIGKVMDSPLDYYNNRVPKKERKRTLVEELMADAEFNKYNKRKYKEIIEEKQKTHYKAYRHAKKLKRKKK